MPKLYDERMVKVFVARGGKKFFQREAARRRGAWDVIKEHCTCHWDVPEEDGDSLPGGFVRCKYHQEFVYDNEGDLARAHRGATLHRRLMARSKREERRQSSPLTQRR
jgi:hypothetical protein